MPSANPRMKLLSLVQRRLIIVTGKGGVGKTVLTATLARAFAAAGKRVLVTEIVPSADTPSALQPVLGCGPLREEPQLAAPGLWTALLTPTVGHLRFLQDALPLRVLADAAMRSQAVRKFLAAAPGFSDMGVMYRMLDLLRQTTPAREPAFEVCLVDSPATGHALALAQIPEFLTRVIRAGPISRAAAEGVRILTDPALCTCVLVTLPEVLPVTEALELERGLTGRGLSVSALVVNRVPVDPFSTEERAALQALLAAQGPGLLGAREVRRIERAEAALRQLRAGHPPYTELLPESEATGPALIDALLARLQQA
jgi:arsenite/tail-anchored protein-transporting ATPase